MGSHAPAPLAEGRTADQQSQAHYRHHRNRRWCRQSRRRLPPTPAERRTPCPGPYTASPAAGPGHDILPQSPPIPCVCAGLSAGLHAAASRPDKNVSRAQCTTRQRPPTSTIAQTPQQAQPAPGQLRGQPLSWSCCCQLVGSGPGSCSVCAPAAHLLKTRMARVPGAVSRQPPAARADILVLNREVSITSPAVDTERPQEALRARFPGLLAP